MRLFFVMAGLAIMSFGLSEAAEARSKKPLSVKLKARQTYLDAGKFVPIDSQRRYVVNDRLLTPSAYAHVGERYGESVLPPRIGGGRSPFGNF